MSYTPISTPGAKIYISSTPTGSATLEILGVKSVDRIGSTSAEQDRTTMRDTVKRKGKSVLEDYGTCTVKGLWSNQDAGQQMLKTARASASPYNFKATLNDATQLGLTNDSYFSASAYVMGFDLEPGGVDGSDLMFTATLAMDSAWTETASS